MQGLQMDFSKLKVGDVIEANSLIEPYRVKYWTFASECPNYFRPIQAGTKMKITDVDNSNYTKSLKAFVTDTTDETLKFKIASAEVGGFFVFG